VVLSQTAYTATTQNGSPSFATGSVALADDDSGVALFSAAGLTPTSTALTKCITVTYSGSLAASVRLYGSITGGTGLGTYLNLTVERGSGGSYASCTGFAATETAYSGTLAGFVAAHTNHGNGAGTWNPASSGSAVYRFTVTVQDPPEARNKSVTATLTWEARSV
jgi:hypothetical protein